MPEKVVDSYDFSDREHPRIGSHEIPWHLFEVGPLVEPIGSGEHVHVLWIPVLINSALPVLPFGRPEGEPLLEEKTS